MNKEFKIGDIVAIVLFGKITDTGKIIAITNRHAFVETGSFLWFKEREWVALNFLDKITC